MRIRWTRTALVGAAAVMLVAAADQPQATAQTPPPGGLKNLGVTGYRDPVALDGGGIALRVDEDDQGLDLNGDGDTRDEVIHRVDPTGTVTNLGIALPERYGAMVVLDGGGIAFNSDMNWSLHRVDAAGNVTNLAIASYGAEALDGGGIATPVRERNTDLNGDGDTADLVLHSVDAAGTVTNLALATGGELMALDGGGIAASVGESSQGTDLNGDGDTDDWVIHRVDAAGTVTNLAIASSGGQVALDGGGIAITAHETDEGRDLNSDGDTDDEVIHRVDAAGTVTNLAIARYGEPVALDGGGIAASVGESSQGTDLNGDGDTADSVIHRVDAAGTVTNLTIAHSGEPVALDGGGIAASVGESSQGTDLNGDGDTADSVIHRVDPAGTVTNLGIALPEGYRPMVALDGGGIAFPASETGEGRDLNSDGDTADEVIHRVDPAGTVTNLTIAGYSPVALDGGGIAISASETGEGRDLNGDGDTVDVVIHRVDAAGTVTNLTIAGYSPVALDGGGIAISAYETDEGRDLNSDGDTADRVLHMLGGDIAVTNDTSPTWVAEPGGDVTHTVAVTNTSFVDSVTIGSLTDDVYGPLSGDSDCQSGIVLAPGAMCRFDFNATVTGWAGPTHTSTVTVAGTDDHAVPVSGSDDATVTVTDVASSITVTNDANPTTITEPGGDITYTVAVTNTSLLDSVTIDSLTDRVSGNLAGQGDCALPQTLAPSATYTCTFTATVTGNAGRTHTSTVTAAGTYNDGNTENGSDDATVTVTDVASSITVTNDADPALIAEPGGDVTYTVAVSNTSPVDAVLLGSLTDSVSGDLAGQGDCALPQTLVPSATYTCTFTAAVTAGAGVSHTSTVTVAGADDDGVAVGGSDDATVLVTEAAGPVVVTNSGGDDITVDLGGAGAIFSAEAVEVPADPPPPPGAAFPYGLVGFTVVGLTEGATATVTLDYPAPLPGPFTYYKLQGGTYVDATSIATHDNGRVTLTLVDNGPFDSDPAPGVITDPGGPANFGPPTGELVISKVFDPLTSGVTRPFTIDWSCDNATAGTVEVAGGASATVAAIPVGTVCSVSEAHPSDAPAGWSYQTPNITGSPATITANTPATVTVTNTITRLTRPLKITKAITGAPGGFLGLFMIHVECSGDGGTYNRLIAWPLIKSVTIPAIPANTQCSVSETSTSAPPPGFAWAAPTISPNPVTIPLAGTAAVTVTNRLLDTAAPTATFTRPGPNNPLLRGRPILLNGNATDNVGVTAVTVAIRNTTTGRYLQPNGTWTPAYATLTATLGSPGARNTTWRISRALPDGNYSIELVPTDAAGHTPTPKPTRNFRVDAP